MRVVSQQLLILAGTAAGFAVSPLRAPIAGARSAVSMQVAAPAPEMVESALKSITLTNAAGDTATVYTFGACVTSYVKGGTDYLMVRPDAKMDGSKPISGGIPHCFPQFGPGAIQQHGFARNLDWTVASQSEDALVLTLSESAYTMDMWPHPFEAKYTISLGEDKLSTELCITNTGSSAFDFTAALHSYWSASSMANIKITSPSFDGATYLNKMLDPPAQVKSADASITISEEVDSVYEGVSGDVLLEDSARSGPLTISNTLGWSDTVIWNPYGSEAMGFDSFVCVESAQASSPILLQPQEYWVGCMDVVP